ncbi:MAG: hypothetical protein AB7E51_10130 [Pseudodesulfovibrio sp.]|jgi:hypothetical protein|uniref:Uncharacterized protein n=1 Tax=Pseudodesulfovibrio indicus TaxID=1716143 RepID=A0A140D9P7_9BACT|nr:hypothetical protein [Pseudodesulfovibrio indicus]AMK09914.1 hypothetical protein AWY79_01695 [Pseudodesulfovibrio indicus]TDT87405.1 hypothetical protein EDC59_10870 [Pseudodesulfovibrio indicus]
MSTQSRDETVMDVVVLGLKTWLAEVKWLTRSLAGRFEIGRLEKELDREYGILGRIAEAPRGRMEEKELCLKQIAFLREEIAHLKEELANDREARMRRVRGQDPAQSQGEEQ